ncbi:nucleotide triphosphate diphosphatase NUDT15 [Rickettsia asembonensis]|uniref:nucleotide triphosphate diphosphatase NUDT15 n=1 Tax=Rickettsia asembonensis TaxID=1068590 RepID=UPI0023F7033D|nr:NUDIX hydrolase [Rickettsia asembonensis]WCR57092.1 MAG: NADH pyrophosphatase [Rickettsia asembonensis]
MTNHPRIGIGILIFNNRNKILLGKRISSHGESSYAAAGGHLEFGETFEECAIREVLEETNLIIENPQFIAVTNDVFEKEQKHYVSIFLKAHCLNEHELQNLEPHKVENWQWFAIDNLPSSLFLPLKRLIKKKCYLYKEIID